MNPEFGNLEQPRGNVVVPGSSADLSCTICGARESIHYDVRDGQRGHAINLPQDPRLHGAWHAFTTRPIHVPMMGAFWCSEHKVHHPTAGCPTDGTESKDCLRDVGSPLPRCVICGKTLPHDEDSTQCDRAVLRAVFTLPNGAPRSGFESTEHIKILAPDVVDPSFLKGFESPIHYRKIEGPTRKQQPLATGCLDYFPDALLAVAHCSFVGNEQHNPGQKLHWDRSKSTDEADALLRHLKDRGTLDTDGIRHSAKVAWRSLSLLQREIEAEQGK